MAANQSKRWKSAETDTQPRHMAGHQSKCGVARAFGTQCAPAMAATAEGEAYVRIE